MSPRPTTGHVRRPAILKAAAEVIAERGVIGTRIADIAERAGTSAPGVLYWFDTKDELLTEALSFADDRFYEELHGELAQLDGARARLRRIVELWPAEGDDEAVLWMELWVRALRDPQVNAARARLDGRWRAAIADIVREGQAAGEFGPVDADEFALAGGGGRVSRERDARRRRAGDGARGRGDVAERAGERRVLLVEPRTSC